MRANNREGITEYKRMEEEALRESEENLRMVFESSPDVIFVTNKTGTHATYREEMKWE